MPHPPSILVHFVQRMRDAMRKYESTQDHDDLRELQRLTRCVDQELRILGQESSSVQARLPLG